MGGAPDFLICSSLLHELEKPDDMLLAIHDSMDEKSVVHINVPNANSLHRILARDMRMISDVHSLSRQNIKLQQQTVFDLDSLISLVESCGFEVIDQGSYFVKPFTHKQMQQMLDEKIISEETLDGFYKLTEQLPVYGSEIFVNCRIKV